VVKCFKELKISINQRFQLWEGFGSNFVLLESRKPFSKTCWQRDSFAAESMREKL
jgi:hypothetical protein